MRISVLVILLGLSGFFLLIGCTAQNTPNNCGEVYFVKENLNKAIMNKEVAYAELIKLAIPLDKSSAAYKDYYNSLPADIVYKQIRLTVNEKYVLAYVLKGWNAIDENGQTYARALCQ
ncbi:hypothetical protein HZB88_00400 [archaeon]|nr:hypothetical protein [archaeon]